MKLLSWNVNGLRACAQKGFWDFFGESQADVFCVQETKMQPEQAELPLPQGYSAYWNSAEKKGYSGTAVFTRLAPQEVVRGIGLSEFDSEGRVLALEFPGWYLVNVYSPNAQRGLARIDYRERFEDAFRAYLQGLLARKPVIVCGDMNVARAPIDLKNAKANEGNAGYSQPERAKMELLLHSGFTDTFRALYPERAGAYTWWSYMYNARANNVGWRIDYFLCADSLRGLVRDSELYPEVMGSDHCPIGLTLQEISG